MTISKEERVKKTIALLLSTNKKYDDIGKETGFDRSTISKINKGEYFRDPSLEDKYPLRDTGRKEHRFLYGDDIEEIYNLLLNSDLPFHKIAKRKDIAQSTLSNINSGRFHYNPDFEGKYPLRPRGRFKEVKLAQDLLLNSDLPISEIARKTDLAKVTIHKINRGERVLGGEDFSFPIRKKEKKN